MIILDALDTLWIMDLLDEFEKGRQWLVRHLDFKKVKAEGSFFETTIRAVGGMLSAYELSKDPIFLNKSCEIVDK